MRVLPFLFFNSGLAAIDRISSSSTTSATSSSSSTTAASETLMVWTTLVDATTTADFEVAFTQSFSSFWSTLATPPSGTVGLGDIQGTVGTVRTTLASPAPGNYSTIYTSVTLAT